VFETEVLRRIFESKRQNVIIVWRKLNNEQLHDEYYVPYINRMIISKRVAQ
jgi:hypothetical protein